MSVLCLPMDRFLGAFDEGGSGYAEWSRRSCRRTECSAWPNILSRFGRYPDPCNAHPLANPCTANMQPTGEQDA
jgi:hypothetical protein